MTFLDQEKVKTAGVNLSDQIDNVFKLQREFFDRLILLNGGTITLSLTVVGLLVKAEKPLPSWRFSLLAAWGCFVISLIFSALRNWWEPSRLEALAYANHATEVMESVSPSKDTNTGKMTDFLKSMKSLADDYHGKLNFRARWVRFASGLALWSMVTGYVLLAAFVTINAGRLFAS
jgi:hypothetical protein